MAEPLIPPGPLADGAPRPIPVGGDESTLLIGGDGALLLAPQRLRAAHTALEALSGAIAGAGPIARVLAQSDLWERFDALTALAVEPEREGDRTALRRAVAQRIRELALPRATLEALPSNAAAIEAANADLLPGLGSGRDWVEVRARFDEHVGAPLRSDTRHAMRADFRLAFRVLVQAPEDAGGAPRVRDSLGGRGAPLPPGTRLALLGSPIALSAEGDLVPLPLVVLVELRRTARTAEVPRTLADIDLEVLEGRRFLLADPELPRGGLDRLAPDAPMPSGATCSPQRDQVQPLRATCLLCHGLSGGGITGPMAHGQLELFEERDPLAAGREVARRKLGHPSFRALVESLRR